MIFFCKKIGIVKGVKSYAHPHTLIFSTSKLNKSQCQKIHIFESVNLQCSIDFYIKLKQN